MDRWPRRLLVVALALLLLTAGALTSVYMLPVSWGLGPCLKDWTSPSSYRARTSPLETLRFALGEGHVQVCYGRPSARNRTVFGRLVPYGQLWRTGATEPTRLYTDVPLSVAGIEVPPGRYSLYSVPGEGEWTVALNRSTFHWGLDFSEGVLRQEVGRAVVPADTTRAHVETFTIREEPPGGGGQMVGLVLEWERTRVVIPVRARPAPGGRGEE